jgi:hypothetical protein
MTAKGLLVFAAAIALVYAGLHLAGGRHYAAFLSGTPVGGPAQVAFGCAYVVMHFAFVIGAPVLALGSLLTVGLARLGRRA